jgi:hypothetical protein
MPRNKTIFDENEEKIIYDLFQNATLTDLINTIPKRFKELTSRTISYRVLSRYYKDIIVKKKIIDSNNRLNSISTNNSTLKILNNDNFIVYDNHLVSFLTKLFLNNNVDNYIKLKSETSLNKFYKKYDLKSINMSSNGLSAISSIYLFFKQFLNINYDKQSLLFSFKKYFSEINLKLTNLHLNIENYFESKIYDHVLCNSINNNLSKLFDIKIFIIVIDGEDTIDSIFCQLPISTLFDGKFILLKCEPFILKGKDCLHFDLITHSNVKMKYCIDLSNSIDTKILNELTTNKTTINNYDSIRSDEDSSTDQTLSSDEEELAFTISKSNLKKNININIKPCKCGSLEHQRTSHYNCTLNKYKKPSKTFQIAVNNIPFNEKIIIGDDITDGRNSIGKFSNKCDFCNALLLKSEAKKLNKSTKISSGICCSKGRYSFLPEKKEPPEYICNLLRGKDANSNHFRENIRGFNSAMAFTSFGAKIDKDLLHNGVPIIKIHGTTYHQMGSMLTTDKTKTPMFAQLYLYDAEYEQKYREKNFDKLNKNILNDLRILMHNNNPYVKKFKQINNDNLKSTKAIEYELIIKDDSIDRKTHNKPVDSDFAVIIPGK